jgi:hypothetical protein
MTADEYEAIPFPTDEDFKRYTRSFFERAQRAIDRVDSLYPDLLKGRRVTRLPLFDDD